MNLTKALTKTRNPYHLSEMTELPLRKVREALRGEIENLPGWGRLNLQPFIVSRRHWSATHWPVQDIPNIHETRRLYDQGKVIMCQGRSGDWIIQYAIPVKGRPMRRPHYFYGA